ncbi:hypothetical protein [Bifidobacterium panos]|uniref:Ig-like domain-containing protein n=1 Tax=Bifidobacterium panos TaxID=2675321 RepID=A0ABX1SXC8_9BIFI|nr:hypothetical protein [Bifidobacterium sp. DSM 109963]NMN02020.1 hypothetical protein [Bifidobacterium sp. DSM 109963]
MKRMVTTFDLRRLWRCVMVLLIVVASLAVATPGVRANDAGAGPVGRTEPVGPTISGLDKRTNEKIGTGDISYRLGNAMVKGRGSKTLTIGVSSGWFEIPDWRVGGVELAVALNEEEKLLTSWRWKPHTLKKEHYQHVEFNANERYRHVELNAKRQTDKRMSAEDIEEFLHGITFHFKPGETQTVWVSATYEQLKAHRTTKYDGSESYETHLLNGHAYAFATDFDTKFKTGYEQARKTTFAGAAGYLMTIESEGEHNAVYHALGEGLGWIGATNAVSPDDAKANGSTITLGKPGQDWYWVSGPNAGTKFWSGGNKVLEAYANWADGHPKSLDGSSKESDGSGDPSKLCCVQYGWSGLGKDDGGKWITLTSDGHHASEPKWSTIRGYYVEFDEFDPSLAGQVTTTSKMVTVSSDLHEVSSSNTTETILSHTQYETTLTANDGREMDPASVKVTVGGKPLDAKDYTFDKATGTLTIPAEKVSGNLHIDAMAKRLVTIKDGLTATLVGTVHVPNNAPVDKSDVDKLAGTRKGYTLTGYTTQDGTLWDFSKPVTTDMTLTAQQELNAPTVSFFPPDPRLDRTGETLMLRASSHLDGVPGARFTYAWEKDGVPIEGGAEGVLMVTDEGMYTVTVTAMDPSTNRTSHATGTVEVKSPHQWQVTLQGRNGFSWLVKQLTVFNGDKLNRGDLDKQAALPGYTITGYTKSDGTQWLFETGVREHMTLYPQYQMITPKVTVSADRSRLESPGDKSRLTAQVLTQVPDATFTYAWSKNGMPITGATGQEHQAGEPGTYTVEVTVMDPRTGVSAKGTASVTVTASDKYEAAIEKKPAEKKPAERKPAERKPAEKKPDVAKKALVDTGLDVLAPAVALVLMLAIAGALAALRRRNK